jgi:rubredoxin
MICPECGEAQVRFQEADSIETHGLECGPYEIFHDEWWDCPACGARFTDRELEAA